MSSPERLFITPRVLVLFGAGGHGRVVADAALMMQAWGRIVGTDDDDSRCAGFLVPEVPLLAMTDGQVGEAVIHVCIGHNATRARIAARWPMERWATVVHTAASVSRLASVGAGSFIAAGAILAPNAKTGVCCIINHGAIVDHDACVGAYSHLGPAAVLGGGVVLGEDVMVGAGAVVLPGVAVADHVVIGAGSVVCAPLLEPGTYVGVPTRRVK